MWLGFLLLAALAVGLGAFFGAPYLPTHQQAIKPALALLNLKPGELLLDLGAGDGRLLVAAAKLGWRVVGYELNPLFWLICYCRIWRWRRHAKVKLANYLNQDWPDDTVAVYIFGSTRAMSALVKKLNSWPRPIRVVSYGFKLPGHIPSRTKNGFFVYDIKMQGKKF